MKIFNNKFLKAVLILLTFLVSNFFYFFSCYFSDAWAGKVFDLDAAIQRGLEYNPSLQAIRETLLGAEQGIKSAKGAFGPSLSGSYTYTQLDHEPRQNAVLNLNVHQPLFTGFNLLSNYEKSLLARDQAQLNLKQARLQLSFDIRNTFFDLLKAKENVKSAHAGLERLRAHLKVSQAFYDVGLKTKLDVLQAQVEVAEAEQSLLAAQNAVLTQRARLNSLLNINVNEDVRYSGNLEFLPFTLTLEECLEKARKNRPDLKLAEKSILVATKESKIVASGFYPQIGADLDYYRYGDDFTVSGSKYQRTSEWKAGVNLQWKFFEWGRTYHAYKQAKHTIFKLEAESRNLRNQASFEVKAAYLKIKESAKRIIVARKGLEEARESYRMARVRYEAQVGTGTEVLDAQADLARSEANLTLALADYLKAIASIYLAMGEEVGYN
ncbi:TolC family protein [Desulfohalobiaceae bacterium Ax17]|uniref:TolC family protein n=1 Tax=Desulfovulcanus ferrireducens TaxID=2831190 RepID=UPI00207BBCE8|nr:TolC family protein [Desulfovulcanus ferrireducens]MBT8763104.1 TolC family protein [Desulfovulcanus ferrireducens]